MKISRSNIFSPLLAIILLGFFFALSPAQVKGSDLGPATRQCLSCHKSGLKIDLVFHKEGAADHPIGLDYVKLAKANPSLVPPARLNPALRLEHGRIVCQTCHVAYDKKNHLILAKKRAALSADSDPMLTIDNNGSGLCLACHQK